MNSAHFLLVTVVSGMLVWGPSGMAQDAITGEHGVTKVEITIEKDSRPVVDGPLMQVALLLDTSNSMDGLIKQAQTQLWAIVNELATKQKHGVAPRLEVALFEYGNNGLPATENYLRQVVPLTQDLDTLSEALFALTTNGGSEYCGAVLDEATSVLNWRPGRDHYKAIFIAGNEPFTQGGVDYAEACSRARAEGVIVNTIHCGPQPAGINGKWQHGAKLGGGKFMTIDQDRAIDHIHCPQDEVLLRLNIELNATYLPYGAAGAAAAMRQAAQDNRAHEAAPQAAAQRILCKSNDNAYGNAHWDMVDAFNDDEAILDKLANESLPEHLRGKSKREIKAAIATQSQRRSDIQARIQQVAAERQAHLTEQLKQEGTTTLGNVVAEVIRQQANDQGFE